MGKWSAIKDQLVKFEHPPGYQQKVDEVKTKLNLHGLKTADVCRLMSQAKAVKDDLTEKLGEINAELEALNQVLVTRFEDEGDTSKTNEYGTFFVKDDPYTSVADKATFNQWVRDTKQDALFSVPYQTVNSMAKEALEAGEDLPPGLSVFMKTTIQLRKK